MVLHALSGCFVGASLHVWALLLGPATLRLLLFGLLEAWQGTVAHATLTVTSKRVVTGKASATRADERTIIAVDGDVALEVVLANKGLLAEVALELTVTKMRLNVSTNVLLAAETPVAAREEAWVLLVFLAELANVLLDLPRRDASINNCCWYVWAKVVEQLLAWRQRHRAIEVEVGVVEVWRACRGLKQN